MTTGRPTGARDQATPRFVRGVADGLRQRLPQELRSFTFTGRSRLGQFAYGTRGLHYEVWLHDTTGHLEIGFHMEADPATNAALYDFLEDALPWLKAQLGPSIELERWDRGWCRLYRTLPLTDLSPELQDETCDCLATLIEAVQPLCAEWAADQPPSPTLESQSRTALGVVTPRARHTS